MDLIGRDRPPLKQSQANMKERVGLRAASGKILALGEPIAGRRVVEGDPVALWRVADPLPSPPPSSGSKIPVAPAAAAPNPA